MGLWVWAVLLLVLGLCLVVLEIFVPSGGILAFLTICAVIAAVVLAFWQNTTVGFIVLFAAVVALPVVVALALRFLPETAMGRRVLLSPPTSDEVLPQLDEKQRLLAKVGKMGRAKSKMLPSGIVQIDHETFDAVGEGMAIDEGQMVRVLEVRGNRLVVEGIRQSDVLGDGGDPLARPVDWETFGPMGPPPA